MHRPLSYWPLSRWFVALLAALAGLVVVLIEAGLVGFAYQRLGLSRYWAYATLAASVLGSRINLAVARLPGHVEEVDAVVVVFGVPYVVPALARTGGSIVAVNVGGALVPCTLATYLVVHDALGWPALGAVALVTAVSHIAARPVAGVGIVVPTLVPPVAAVAAAAVFGGDDPAAIAYVSGTFGTLVGADVLHLRAAHRLGAAVLSIGGAGTFDGIFVTGVVAVLLAAL